MQKIDAHLKALGCDGAILACTELSCYKEYHPLDSFYTDSLESLCKKSIVMCGGKLKGEKMTYNISDYVKLLDKNGLLCASDIKADLPIENISYNSQEVFSKYSLYLQRLAL